MTVDSLISTIVSVDYMFGATTALACTKAVRRLVQSVIGRATNMGAQQPNGQGPNA